MFEQEAASDFVICNNETGSRKKRSPDLSRTRGANFCRPSAAAVSFAKINSPSFPRTHSEQHSQ